MLLWIDMNKIKRKNKKKNPYRSSVNRTYEMVSLGLQSELLWLMTYQPFNKFAINNCKSRIRGLKSMKKLIIYIQILEKYSLIIHNGQFLTQMSQ